jgi:hypothetical protein
VTRSLAVAALAVACAASLPASIAAQHGLGQPPGATAAAYDPAVPTPRQVLGYDLGDRFTPHHLVMRYFEAVARARPERVRLDTLGHTFEGREVVLAAVTGEGTRGRLDAARADAARLADPRAVPAGERAALAARTPAVLWLGHTVHGNEASGVEAAIALLYQLAAGRDAETRLALDSAVVLVDPLQNPDGHERHAQDAMRARTAFGVPASPFAMAHQGSWPGGRGSHYYFDLNRDWFIQSHPETRARVRGFLAWMPHAAVDLHEMGSNSTYFFAPPMDPFNKNAPANVVKWWDVYAAGNAAAFDRRGWPYFRREGYDEFYPGYGISWPTLTGAVGMTYEEASSGGGAIRRADGTVLTLRDAAERHYTAAWATVMTTARRRGDRVREYAETRASAAGDATRDVPGGMPLRAVLLERDADGRADALARLLGRNGIEVRRLVGAADAAGGAAYPGNAPGAARLAGGAYVVDLAQPQGRLARALLEPDAVLDSAFVREELERRRTAQPSRVYDVTAWSLPYAFRVRAWGLRAAPAGTEAVPAPPAGDEGDAAGSAPNAAAPDAARASYGYAFAPGSEASLRLLAGLLADSVRVWLAARPFRVGGAAFPRGAFVVRVAGNDSSVHARVRRLAAARGAAVTPLNTALVDEGTDLGSNSVAFVRPVRVALLGGPSVVGTSFGFAWFALDRRIGHPSTPVDVASVAAGALREFDLAVLPSAQGPALDRALGDAGRERLAAWVRDGGVLVTLDAATGWLAGERVGLSRLRLRRDSAGGPGGDGGAPLPASVPGAIVRATGDRLSPLLAGVDAAELPVLVNSDRVLAAPRDVRPGELVIRHAPADRLRLAGYLWPEVPARLAGTPYLWTERVGNGRIIAFAEDPNFRDLWRGLLPLFGNAVLLGASF